MRISKNRKALKSRSAWNESALENRPHGSGGTRRTVGSLLALILASTLACASVPRSSESGTTASVAAAPRVATMPDVAAAPAPVPAGERRPASVPFSKRIAKPPLYRIDGGAGARLLVMGTVHLGPQNGWRFSREVQKALAGADRFILEIDPRLAVESSVADALAARVVLPPSQELNDVISPATAKLIAENEAALSGMGIVPNARRRMKPWYLVLGIQEQITARAGFPVRASAEQSILSALNGRPLVGLETLEEQLDLFDNLSPQLQDLMLQDTLVRLENLGPELVTLMDAWSVNDQAALIEIALEGLEELPELDEFYDILLTQRNRRWASTLAAKMKDPALAGEFIFVGVGALHLVGDNSLIDLMQKQGFRTLALHPTGQATAHSAP